MDPGYGAKLLINKQYTIKCIEYLSSYDEDASPWVYVVETNNYYESHHFKPAALRNKRRQQ